MLQYNPNKRMNIEELSKHDFLTKKVINFCKIDLDLYTSKLTTSGIRLNTKNNNDMQLSTINNILNLIPEELSSSTKIEVPEFPHNSQYKINNLNKNCNNFSKNDNFSSKPGSANAYSNNGCFNKDANINVNKYFSDKQIKHINNMSRNNMISNGIKMNGLNSANNLLARNSKPLPIQTFKTNTNRVNYFYTFNK